MRCEEFVTLALNTKFAQCFKFIVIEQRGAGVEQRGIAESIRLRDPKMNFSWTDFPVAAHAVHPLAVASLASIAFFDDSLTINQFRPWLDDNRF